MRLFATLLFVALLALPAAADEIDALIDSLGSDDWSAREKATEELTRLGARAVPHLERAANGHSDLEVRHRARKILDSFVYSNPDFLLSFVDLGEEAIPRLAEIVGRADESECAAAADVLGRIASEKALELLLRLASHASEIVRARTATALDRFDDPKALEALRTMGTAGELGPARLSALTALARQGDETAIGFLFENLSSEDLRVRQTATSALSVAFAREGREDVLADRFRTATTPFARRLVLALLSGAPSKKGAAILMAAASNPQHEEPVRAEALRVLGAAEFPDAERFLAEFARHRGGVLGVVAAESLARYDRTAASDLLGGFAGSSDAAIREAARGALERVGGAK